MAHIVDFLVGVVAVFDELPNRRRDGIDERCIIPEIDVRYGVNLVRLIFLGPVMAASDLDLVIEPVTPVQSIARIPNPLPESIMDAIEVSVVVTIMELLSRKVARRTRIRSSAEEN